MRKINNDRKNKARVLFVDIEATNLAASMGYLLSIGYKFNDQEKPHVLRIDQTKEFKKKRTDDKGLLKAFEPIYNQADLIVAHFGDYYDIPFIQTRRLIKGLPKLPDVKTVDTWKIARKHMKFHRNRLDAILTSLHCPYKKTPLDGEKWIDAAAGIPSAINYIVHHNKMDVLVEEWVYNKIAPMLPNHPTLHPSPFLCPVCGSDNWKGHGRVLASKYWYQRLLCRTCGTTRKGNKL